MRYKNDQFLPDFLIIGAGKSGTTSLDQYLGQHPQIFMSQVKEPNFFAYEKHKEEDFPDKATRNHYNSSVTNLEEYLSLFQLADNRKLIGEVSNTYMYMPHSLNSIKYYIPNAKIIAILRQPAERLFSRYTHLLRDNKVPTKTFDDVFDRESVWWQRADLVQEGFYAKHLKKFYQNFHETHIKILFFEDLIKEPNLILREITDFLKVEPMEFMTDTSFNKSGKIKNGFVNKLVGHESIIIKSLKKVMPGYYKRIKSNNIFKKMVEEWRSGNIEKVILTPELKNKITKEIYENDINELQLLIKKDLSHWIN